jgi:hypothetical protein
MALWAVTEKRGQFCLEGRREQVMTHPAEEDEEFGSPNARNNCLFYGRQLTRWMPERWTHGFCPLWLRVNTAQIVTQADHLCAHASITYDCLLNQCSRPHVLADEALFTAQEPDGLTLEKPKRVRREKGQNPQFFRPRLG